MNRFIQNFRPQLAEFEPFFTRHIQPSSSLFSLQAGTVAQFVAELQQTAQKLVEQSDSHYTEYYANRLIQQFHCLKQELMRLQGVSKDVTQFQSTYRPPKNIHHLPIEKRRVEYQKALRALNEKLAWLTEQCYVADPEQRAQYIALIEETEYRKYKCLNAIQELENPISKS